MSHNGDSTRWKVGGNNFACDVSDLFPKDSSGAVGSDFKKDFSREEAFISVDLIWEQPTLAFRSRPPSA